MAQINLYFRETNKDNYDFVYQLAETNYDGNLSQAINAIITKYRTGNNGSTIEQRLDQILLKLDNLQIVQAKEIAIDEGETVSGIGGDFFK